MRNPQKSILAGSILCLAFLFSSCEKGPLVKTDVDWESFLAKHDMTWDPLSYSAEPEYWKARNQKHHHGWNEGAFTGNGMIGSMIYKEAPEVLRFQLGRYDVNSHRQVEKIDWTVPRLLIGDFLLSTEGEIKNENMRLDLWNAEVRGSYETSKGGLTWRSFTHAEEMLIIVELQSTGEETLPELDWRPESGISPRWWYSPDSANVKVKMPPPPCFAEIEGISVSTQEFAETGEFAVAWKKVELAENHSLYYISIENSYPENEAEARAVSNVQEGLERPFEKLLAEHRAFWHSYYPQSFLSIPDKQWEGFYWIQMYKLASATRSDRALIDNSGPWLPLSPWPGVWWNLNVELSYSSLYAANRLNISESLLNRVHERRNVFMHDNLPDSLKGKNCAMVDRCSDNTFVTGPGYLELGNLTWVLYTCWKQYSYSMDTSLLSEKIYPLLKANINTYLHLMYEGEDGKLHLPPTHSPEYGRSLKVQDANYALALFRWGCKALLEANEILGMQDEQVPQWEYVLENLVEAPKDENGYMVGHDVPFAMSHRHYSHLFEIYPLHLISADSEENEALIERSIAHWIGFEGALAGYSFTAASSMYSSLGDGERALEYLDGFVPYLCPNTMYVEAGQVIETPLACAQSIQEMLLQSWGGIVRVFPAVSEKWEDVSFDKLLAEGAFEVSASRAKGKTAFIKVKSLRGGALKLQCEIENPVLYRSGESKDLDIQNKQLILEMNVREEIILFDSKNDRDFVIKAVEKKIGKYNSFGMARKGSDKYKQLHNPA